MEELSLYLGHCHLLRNTYSKEKIVKVITNKSNKKNRFLSRSRYLPQVCEFRNGFEYNNHMLSLAGETIAAIAGSTLQNMVGTFVANKLFI